MHPNKIYNLIFFNVLRIVDRKIKDPIIEKTVRKTHGKAYLNFSPIRNNSPLNHSYETYLIDIQNTE